MKRNIPFARPNTNIKEIISVAKSIKSGWMTTGKVCHSFEQEFKDRLSVPYTIAVNSATAGLHLAYEALGVKTGKFIITSPYTFTATAEAARYLGADIVFCDIDKESLNICVIKLEELLEQLYESGEINNLAAIVPIHIAGRACDMEQINKLAKKFNIPVVEDAAHAFPAKYNDKYLGTLSDIGVFSFYATKTMTTGEGGLIVAHKEEIAKRLKLMRLHGIDRDVWGRFNNAGASWEYDVVEAGYKYNLADINASIGIVQLKKAEKFAKIRHNIAKLYYKLLADCQEIILPKYEASHSWHLFIIKIKDTNKFPRNSLIEFLSKKGVGTSVHYKPLHLMSYYQKTYDLNEKSFPISTEVFNSVVSLPIYPGLKKSDIKFISKKIKEFFDNQNN